MSEDREISISERRTGILCVFAAAVLYSLGGLLIKLIPWNALSINGARNLVALVVVGGYLCLSRHRIRFNRWIALGAVGVCGTNVLFSMANKMTTAANAIVLQFTAPIFVILLSVVFLKKKPRKLDLAACAAVIFGVILCFLDGLSVGGTMGDLLALLSGVTYACIFLMNTMPDGDPICSVFWGDVVSAVIGLPFLLRETNFSPTALVSVLILGAFQVGLAYVLMCIGLRTTPPVTASLISGIEPVLNPLLVALFYHEMLGPLALAGAAVVIISVVAYNLAAGQQENARETKTSK